jgi:hypothetical protein
VAAIAGIAAEIRLLGACADSNFSNAMVSARQEPFTQLEALAHAQTQ